MNLNYYSSLSSFSVPLFSFKPIILLCPDQEIIDSKWKLKFPEAAQYYVEALKKEGAEVIVLKGYNESPEDLLNLMDGWLIPGGLDIDPKKYKAENRHPKIVSLKSHDLRFDFESRLYKNSPKMLPVLGICYGSQFLNVMQGKGK